MIKQGIKGREFLMKNHTLGHFHSVVSTLNANLHYYLNYVNVFNDKLNILIHKIKSQ